MTDGVKLDTAIKFGAGRVRCERGLLEDLGNEFVRFSKRPYIIAGPRAWDAVKERLVPALEAAHLDYQLKIYVGQCCFEGAEELAQKAQALNCDEVIGVGGGKITDFVKAVAEIAHLGAITVPTSASCCAPFTCMSVMYTVDGKKLKSWRFDHEIDGCYMDLDVIAACPIRYNAAGVMDAMAKKIEMLNGKPKMLLSENGIDVFSAYSIADYMYGVLESQAREAIDDNRCAKVTKALEDVAFLNVILTGVIANITKSYKQSELAHVIYDGIRTHFYKEAKNALHGEIVGIGLFCQLYYNDLKEKEQELREFMKSMDMPLTLEDIGIEPTEENLMKLEEYIVNSRHFNSDDPKDHIRLHEAVKEMV